MRVDTQQYVTAAPAWPLRPGNAGQLCWDTPWGNAYGASPPIRQPLTFAQIEALPDGKRVAVLWMGGNGLCEYIVKRRNGRMGVDVEEAPGKWWVGLEPDFVGRARVGHKVWQL